MTLEIPKSKIIFAFDGDNTCFQSEKAISSYCRGKGIVLSPEAEQAIAIGTRDNQEANDFLDNHIGKVNSWLPEMPGCKKTLHFLRDHGIITALLTRRGSDIYPDAEELTLKYIKDHEYPFDFAWFGIKDKAEFCRENPNIMLLVDDSIATCENTQAAGTSAIVFNSRLNRDIPTSCPRIETWWPQGRTMLATIALQEVFKRAA
ncbi:hypothetical protein FWC31_02010 [Candidatus Saccharibacteria bacterium]|nr:hypothetical protein [Candidatus Saccharibacteria bacterium]